MCWRPGGHTEDGEGGRARRRNAEEDEEEGEKKKKRGKPSQSPRHAAAPPLRPSAASTYDNAAGRGKDAPCGHCTGAVRKEGAVQRIDKRAGKGARRKVQHPGLPRPFSGSSPSSASFVSSSSFALSAPALPRGCQPSGTYVSARIDRHNSPPSRKRGGALVPVAASPPCTAFVTPQAAVRQRSSIAEAQCCPAPVPHRRPRPSLTALGHSSTL